MNGFDVVTAALLLVALLLGLVGGIVRLAFGIVSMALGGVAAVALAEPAARLAGSLVESPELAHLLGFFGVYAGVLIVFSVLGLLLRRFVTRLGLGWADRVFGALAAILLVAAAASLTSLALLHLAPEAKVVRGSWTIPRLAVLAEEGGERLPRRWKDEGSRIFGIFERKVARAGAPAPVAMDSSPEVRPGTAAPRPPRDRPQPHPSPRAGAGSGPKVAPRDGMPSASIAKPTAARMPGSAIEPERR